MSILESALKILDVLVRRHAVAGHEMPVHEVRTACRLSDSEFLPADTFLLQAKYVDGTMGSRDGSRWLTPAGVQFHHENRTAEKPKQTHIELIAGFVFGVIFVVGLLILAIAFPEPTAFQYTVFRIVLALAASGVVAVIPGFIEIDLSKWLRAGGAIAIFVIVYFFSPASLVTSGRSDTEVLNSKTASIDFKNAAPFVDKVVLTDKAWRGYLFKVQITNNSQQSTLRIKHLELTDLMKLDGKSFVAWEDVETVYLMWDETKFREIPPGGKVFVPFARIYPPELQREIDAMLSGQMNAPQLRFNVGLWPRRMISHIPPGTHRFKIQAFFEKVPPAEVELELVWPGTHRENVDAMAKEVTFRKL